MVKCNSQKKKDGAGKLFKELGSMTPPSFAEIRLASIPDHRGVIEDEAADSLGRRFLQMPITDVILTIP